MVWYHGGGFSYPDRPIRPEPTAPAWPAAAICRRRQRESSAQYFRVSGSRGARRRGIRPFGQRRCASILVAAARMGSRECREFWRRPRQCGTTLRPNPAAAERSARSLAMPGAKGLFQRAIVMERRRHPHAAEHERATRLADAVLGEVGLTAKELDKLQALPDRAPARGDRAGAEESWVRRHSGRSTAMWAQAGGRKATICRITRVRPDGDGFVGRRAGHGRRHRRRNRGDLPLAPDDVVWNRTLGEDELKTRVAEVAGRRHRCGAGALWYRRMHPGQ